MPFTSSKNTQNEHIYETGTTIKDIYAVKKFDDELRLVLFKQIARVEEEIRTVTGYKFDEVNNHGTLEWFQIDAYDTNRNDKQEIAILISRLLGDIRNSKSGYLKHYQETHNVVPSWILVKILRFSTFTKFLSFSKTKVKRDICELYNMKTDRNFPHYILLIGSLQFIREIRNACAHNERVFDIKSSRRINCDYFSTLPPVYNRNQNADKKLLDFIIYMRYFLDDISFIEFIDDIYNLLSELETTISKTAYDDVRGKMGIKNKEHLLLLKTISKTINFLSFS